MVEPIDDFAGLIEHITTAAFVDPLSTLLVSVGSLMIGVSLLVGLWLVQAALVDAIESGV